MNSRRSRFVPAVSDQLETLEARVVLSTTGAVAGRAAEVAGQGVRHVATKTTVSVNAGTLGQPVTFNVTVRAPAASGSPQGTVRLTNHGMLLQSLTLTPAATQGKYAYSQATYTLAPQPGAAALYFGRYTVDAAFTPSGAFAKSTAHAKFAVGQPSHFTTLSDGVGVATIASGSGPAIQSGQTANILYTGYLARTGQIFDASSAHGGAPISFKLGGGQVIPGFDAGIAGMQAGESRIIMIPPSQGYGATTNGSIPPNSTLVFVVTLKSIS